ncbi:MAG: class I SAM-dependent methyltransferase [Gemmatimonadetes bacterium]|nr:class I SAM-dependent methyltransferase [Gemmatimonadota bacterium]MYD12182.1 class I SAM-dependent methyltransferase [Gemmatimonadota bacterium]MYI65576.1 class I SAM-dependent methyltransferase [Gemmatimonadota bacterium]
MTKGPTPWYRDWFGGEYLALYPHRDRAEARQAVELLRQTIDRGPGTRVLDLGCGAGRHLVELEGIGYRATGLDLSMPMLMAAARAAGAGRLVRADMRVLPFASGSFDVVTSYFTSFGYFDREQEDLQVLHEVRRVLAPCGAFLLDFMNAHQVIANLRREDRRTVAGVEVVQERKLVAGGRIVEKRIKVGARKGGAEREFVERVRLYGPEELDSILALAGLEPFARFGGYDRGPLSRSSPRCIVLAEARS